MYATINNYEADTTKYLLDFFPKVLTNIITEYNDGDCEILFSDIGKKIRIALIINKDTNNISYIVTERKTIKKGYHTQNCINHESDKKSYYVKYISSNKKLSYTNFKTIITIANWETNISVLDNITIVAYAIQEKKCCVNHIKYKNHIIKIPYIGKKVYEIISESFTYCILGHYEYTKYITTTTNSNIIIENNINNEIFNIKINERYSGGDFINFYLTNSHIMFIILYKSNELFGTLLKYNMNEYSGHAKMYETEIRLIPEKPLNLYYNDYHKKLFSVYEKSRKIIVTNV